MRNKGELGVVGCVYALSISAVVRCRRSGSSRCDVWYLYTLKQSNSNLHLLFSWVLLASTVLMVPSLTSSSSLRLQVEVDVAPPFESSIFPSWKVTRWHYVLLTSEQKEQEFAKKKKNISIKEEEEETNRESTHADITDYRTHTSHHTYIPSVLFEWDLSACVCVAFIIHYGSRNFLAVPFRVCRALITCNAQSTAAAGASVVQVELFTWLVKGRKVLLSDAISKIFNP